MIANLTIIDHFFADPHGVREFALSHDFTQAPEFDGVKYPGFAPVKDDRFKMWVQNCISEAVGSDIKISMAAFVAGTEEFETQQWIHADNNCSRFAGVFYLFDKAGCGTAFWRHRQLGFTTMSGAFANVRDEDRADHVAAMRAMGRDETQWDRTDYAESVFNRFIYYPTDRIHSRWPRKAFGTTPENCRLTLVVFFS